MSQISSLVSAVLVLLQSASSGNPRIHTRKVILDIVVVVVVLVNVTVVVYTNGNSKLASMLHELMCATADVYT